MRHSWKAEGFGVRIRPVQVDDAEFIIWLRGLEHTQGKIGNSASSLADQEAWITKYFDREDDIYFLVETPSGFPVGTHALTGVGNGSGEAGRLIMRREVPAAVPTSLITFDLAFGAMGFKELRGTSVSTNEKVHSYVKKFGFRQTTVEKGARVIDGQPVDIVHFAMTAEEWTKSRPGVLPIAKYAEKQILNWDKAQKEQPPKG